MNVGRTYVIAMLIAGGLAGLAGCSQILGGGTKRFSDLRREVEPITPRMLTVTLRTLERDGLISRKIYPVVPPRVEYTLTQMGETLVEAVAPLIGWANSHLAEIERARVAYDSKIGAGEDPG